MSKLNQTKINVYIEPDKEVDNDIILYKLTKVSESENPFVPNNIDVGYEKIGIIENLPVVGECFYLYDYTRLWKSLRTSPVVEILSENTFKTLNSIYKYEKYETNKSK